MEDTVHVHPARISQFGSPEDATFCLVTNPNLVDRIVVDREAGYADYRTVPFEHGDNFEDLLSREIPESAHVFVVSPGRFFESPAPERLGARRKLLAMACNSTPASFDVIRHFLGVIERSSASAQAEFSDTFFDLAESTDHLEYIDARHGTRAVLEHLTEGLVWNQQAGPLEWGEQQIAPSGEISVLPIEIREFDESLSLPLDGEIALRGYPILHNGTPSFTRGDQARIHGRLASLEEHAVIAKVVRGRITDLRPYRAEAGPAVEMLEAMFAVDSRYQHVWEIGHAINTSLELLPGNHAMNEVYGGTAGCLHWGIGLTPYTQYHLDIISPDTTVCTDDGRVLLGGATEELRKVS